MRGFNYSHKAIPTKYKGIQFRSRLEARWACFFDLIQWDWEYEPVDLDGWIPDFVIGPDCVDRIFVEVKPYLAEPSNEEVKRMFGGMLHRDWPDEILLLCAYTDLVHLDSRSDRRYSSPVTPRSLMDQDSQVFAATSGVLVSADKVTQGSDTCFVYSGSAYWTLGGVRRAPDTRDDWLRKSLDYGARNATGAWADSGNIIRWGRS